MNKGIRLIKKLVALLLVLLISIESFGAVVSDNDGSAFITKAEFDSLKNNFQSQIDQYNTSIDSKIDGAIASYLAGITITKRQLLINKYNNIELMTGQKMKDLMWTNSTTYCVNACNRQSGTADWQRIWMQGTLNFSGANQDNTAGARGIVHFYDYTASNTTETRVELDRNNRIIAWGDYNVGFELFNTQTLAWNITAAGWGVWIPVQFNAFTGTVRRPWLWKVNADHINESGNSLTETSGAKCQETLPQDATYFYLDDILIAPMSNTNEAFLPPRPLVGDTSLWTEASGTSTNYSEKTIYYNAQDYIQGGTEATNTYHVTIDNSRSGSRPMSLPASGNVLRVFKGLEARWFRIKKFNDVGFKAIYDNWFFDCPIKCGMPMVDKRTYKEEESVIVYVENAASNGYLIPYVSSLPSNNWNGAKTGYAIDKYRITAGTRKKIEVDIDSPGDKIVFVVWLPDTPCILPTLEIYHQSE